MFADLRAKTKIIAPMKPIASLEEKIASKAIETLHAHTGLTLETVEVNSVLGTGLWPDMKFRLAGTQIELISEIKNGIHIDTLLPMVKQLQAAAEGRTPLLIADRIDGDSAKLLRDLNVNYLDAGGNAYLKLSPLFVFIDAQPHADGIALSRPAKPFSPIDLQIIFALLANPGLLNENYRVVSEYANVALGVCGTVFRDLKDNGYFVESNRTKVREWRARHRLIGRWVEQYPTLKKRLYLGPYYTADKDWWRSSEFSKYDVHLGGEFAAASYIESEQAETGSIYLGDQQQWKFIRAMRFIKADRGMDESAPKVNVFSKFWGKAEHKNICPQVTHPLITYADLIDAGDQRSRAAANEIASRYFV